MRRSLNIPKTDGHLLSMDHQKTVIKERKDRIETSEVQKQPLERQIMLMKRRITALEKKIKGHKASIANVYT